MVALTTKIKEVSPDYYKVNMLIEGHPIEMVLEKSQVRELIGVLDNGIV